MSHTTIRNRHHRGEEFHFGELPATLVELSSALDGDLDEGMAIEEAIAILHERILRLEQADLRFGTISANAAINGNAFFANAILRRAMAGSLTTDAAIVLAGTGSLAADAVLRRSQAGSFTADAFISQAVSGSFTADAIAKRPQAGSLTADAVIPDEVGDGLTLGEGTLGDHTLGG